MVEKIKPTTGGEQQVLPQVTPGQKKATAPAPKGSTSDEDRDEFIRNALPVAAALRKSGKPEEAKQLEQVAQAVLQTKSMQPTQQPGAQVPAQEVAVKDLLASVYKAIDQDPALKNMPEAKAMRRASDKLDQDGMLTIAIRNGVVVSFISNFTDNLSRTKQLGKSAPEARPTVAQQATGVVATPPPAAAQADDPNVKVATLLVTSTADAESGKGMSDVLTKRLQDAGATVELVSTKPTRDPEKSLSELKVSYRLDELSIAKVSALLDAVKVMPSGKVQEMPGDQAARQLAAQGEHERQAEQARQQRQAQAREGVQQLVAQPVPPFQAYPAYTLFAPSTENGRIDSRKAIPHDSQHLNVAIDDKGEFGLNPKVDQQRLIGDGIGSMSKFFDYSLPTSGFKIAHVGLAEPGQMKQTETGWEVVTRGKLAITDTEGNVFKPQVSEAQAIVPTPAAQVAQAAPGQQSAPSKGEVLYTSGPPDLRGLLTPHVISSHQAYYSLYQIQVDARDPNRAILLPAPGADASIIAAGEVGTSTAYQVPGSREAHEKFLVVQAPAQLARTADGWKLTEKGAMSFSATESVYQAQQLAPVQQPAPQAGQQPTQRTPFTRADLPTELLASMGVPVAELERTGQLQKLLEGQKTNLIQGFTAPNQTDESKQFAAKLLFTRDDQGVATLRVDLPKRELEIPQQLMGKQITPAMQEQLKTTGVVPLMDGFRDGKDQPFTGYLAVDQEMKRVVAVRPEGLTVPKEVYAVKLSPEQHKSILEGKPTRIEGMIHPGEKRLVDAMVHLDPLARKLVFRDTRLRQEQEQKITQAQEPARRRGVRL